MRNEAILLTNELITELENDGLFSQGDPFLEKEFLFEELLPKIENNLIITGQFTLTDEEFESALIESRRKSKEDALNSLIQKGIVVPTAMNENDEILLGLHENIKNMKKSE
jgi:hypothetical protein